MGEQWRHGHIVWIGKVEVWPKTSSLDNRGRTEPWIPSHFQTWDQLAPRPDRVTITSADWQHHGRPIGTYFAFDASNWLDIFGEAVSYGTVYKDVEQWRDGHIVWIGDVKVWPKTSSLDNRGRTEPWIPSQFQTWDQLCLRPPRVVVSADWQHSNGKPIGTYFSFEAADWLSAFHEDVTHGATYSAKLLRDGHIVWTGDVKVWIKESERPRPYGRANPLIPGYFQTGDQLSPA